MAFEAFGVNTLIIPMDTTFQDNEMFRAYGLVYDLLSNGIPVKWSIQPGKPFDGTDFTATVSNFNPAAPIGSHSYSGGPFIIESSYLLLASPIITAWQLLYPGVNVHVAALPFSAEISATMTRAPRIAVEDQNASVMTDYLEEAGIPDSGGDQNDLWPNDSPDILDEDEISLGALFGYNMSQCRIIAYDIFLSPHTSEGAWEEPALQLELNRYLQIGGMLHATCESIPSLENVVGPFLTQFGMPVNDINSGDDDTLVIVDPDFPIAQGVSTGQEQKVPGGSLGSWFTGEVTYNAQTQILAYFTETKDDIEKQYDFMIVGPYKNGEGAGKIVYEGGHSYDVKLPYTDSGDGLYLRFVYNSLFFSVSKPRIYLEYTPSNIFAGVINTITFSVVNDGGSPAPNTSFSAILVPGMTYNGDATIPPSSIIGQTLTWNTATLGTVDPGTALTFTADYVPPLAGVQKLADFSTSFDDNFNESYSIPFYCVSADITVFDSADLSALKSVDKSFAIVGDTLTYTVVIANSGILLAENVFFQDTPTSGATFIPGSVTIDGAPVPAADPTVGFALPDIPPVGFVTVVFQANVSTIPIIPQILNDATVDYQFTNPTEGTFDSTQTSNTVSTTVEDVSLLSTKSVDKLNAVVGDVLTYTIDITNNGTLDLTNVVIVDAPPANTSFIAGSVFVDGINRPLANPNTGVNIGTLSVGQSAQLTYQVTVDVLPDPPEISNVATIDYEYRVDPQGPPASGSSITSPAITQVQVAELTVDKTSDKNNAIVGENVTYTVEITNTGTVPSNNTFFVDPVPSGTIFVPGSVTVDGVPQLSYNPNIGFNLGTIPVGVTVTITFVVTVVSIPDPNPTINISIVNGQFTIEPGFPPIDLTFDSPPLPLQVETVELTMDKSVDRSNALVGDILNYTAVVTNTGTVLSQNTLFIDLDPQGTSFVAGSVTVGGVPQLGFNPNIGFNIGDIPVSSSITITWQVVVVIIPTPNPTENIATASGTFPVDPGQPPVDESFDSPPVPTEVETALLEVTKTANKSNALVGDVVTYTTEVRNTGTVPSTNTMFFDIDPLGTSFISGSVLVNGAPQVSYDPNVGFPIGTLAPNEFVTLTWSVTVVSIPVPNPTINIATASGDLIVDPQFPPVPFSFDSPPVPLEVETAELTVDKTSDISNAIIGQNVTYTIEVNNIGTVPSDNTFFVDPVPAGTTFVPGSVTVNGVPQLSYNPNIGFNIGTIPVGGTVTITFVVTVVSIPDPNPTINISIVNGQFTLEPGFPPIDLTFDSPPLPLQVETVELTMDKSVDRSNALVGDILNYTAVVTNTGTVLSQNTLFIDPDPQGTSFVAGSVIVGGVPQLGFNPNIGFNIGNIPASSSIVITWQVVVDIIPTPNPTENIATASGTFPVDPGQPPVDESFDSPPVPTEVEIALLELTKTSSKSNALVGDVVTYTTEVRNTGTVPSTNTIFFDMDPTGTSFVAGSVTVNGAPQVSYDPNVGFPIGTLAPNELVTLTWDVTVISIPIPNPTINIATASGDFIVDPQFPPVPFSFDSPPVPLEVEIAELTVDKTSDVSNAIVGQIVTYTIAVTNIGTVPSDNTFFVDPVPPGTDFISGSVTVNGIPELSYNPNIGFNIGTIPVGGTTIITFMVTVVSVPVPNPTINISSVNGQFTLEPGKPPVNLNFDSPPLPLQVETVELTMDKSVDRNNALVGDILNYTAVVTNTGTVLSQNTQFIDPDPQGTIFVAGSVIVDGVPQPGFNPNIGFNIGDIPVSSSVTITWQVVVDIIPTPNPTENIATASGTFPVDPGQPPVQESFDSPPIPTEIETALLELTKTSNKSNALVGDIVTYTTEIRNTGTVPSTNTMVFDMDPPGTSFIAGSVTVNGAPQVSFDPNVGFPIGTLAPTEFVTVSWNVTVISIPIPNPTENIATASGDFLVDPQLPPVPLSFDSPPVPLEVEIAELSILKTANRSNAVVGETVTYSVTVSNTGTVDAENTLFIDPDPPGTSFVTGSVDIDGTLYPTYNPNAGFTLGTIAPGESITITWDVIVSSIPFPNPTENIAAVSALFPVDPQLPPVPLGFNSLPLPLEVETLELDMQKTVDMAFAEVGDILTYTVILTNAGTIDSTNTFFKDILPPGTSFVPGSVTIDGVPNLSFNPNTGFNLGSVIVGQSVVIVWQVTVDILPTPNPIENIATSLGQFQVDPQFPPVQEAFESAPAETLVQIVELTMEKSVDKDLVEVGDILNYSVTITNTGTVESQNTILIDTDPPGTSFIVGTVRVSGNLRPTDDPNIGIIIGSILPGQSITVTWQVAVISVPIPNPTINQAIADGQFAVDPQLPPENRSFDSEEIPTKIYLVQLDVVKTAIPSIVAVGDTVKFVSVVTNNGSITSEDTEFKDPDPQGMSFILQSVYVNGINRINDNPNSKLELGDIPPSGSVTIEWEVDVIEIPVPNPTENIATVEGTFVIDPTIPPIREEFDSPPIPIMIEITELEVNKTVDKSKAHIGDILLYTTTVTNVGTIVSTNTIFSDTDPIGTQFIPGTVTVDGFSRPADDPNVGILLGNLNPGESVIITWQVEVLSIPDPNPTINIGLAEGTFSLDPDLPPETKTFLSEEVETVIVPPNSFKQFDFTGNACLPSQKPDIESILDMSTDYEITSSRVILTPVSTSYEGQILTGFKVPIRGILTLIINYVSTSPDQAVHAGHFTIPFSTFVVLDENYNDSFVFDVKITVEDIFSKMITPRCIFYNITMLAETLF